MITQLGISKVGELHKLEIIIDGRRVTITLTNEEVSALIDILQEHRNTGNDMSLELFTINLN